MTPTRTAMSFDGHWVCFSLPDMFLTQISYMSATFSGPIDLARFRVGLLFSYRADDHNLSSAGCAPTWALFFYQEYVCEWCLWIISTELYETEIRALIYIFLRFQRSIPELWYCWQKWHRVSKMRTAVKRLRYKVFKILVLKFHSFIKLCFLLCSYSAEKFLFGKFLLGRKILIWLKSFYWACSNRAKKFLLGVFLLGAAPIYLTAPVF